MKSKKSALLLSFTSLLICFAMLVGSTFAWFTDTATTGVNKITSGNLDIEAYYRTSANGEWAKIDDQTDLFGTASALFEPGHTRVVELKIKNAGNLALKYKIGMNIASETAGTNKFGKPYKLSDSLKVATTPIQIYEPSNPISAATEKLIFEKEDRSLKWNEVPFANFELEKATNGEFHNIKPGGEVILGMKIYMPETVGNEANAQSTEEAASITFGLNILATQYTYERDSFSNTYDKNAEYPVLPKSIKNSDELDAALTTGGSYKLDSDVENKKDITNDLSIDLNGKSLTIADNTELKNGSNLTVSGGTIRRTTFSGYVDVRPEKTTDSVITYTDVTFENTYKTKTYGPCTDRVESVLEYCPQDGGKATFYFKNCTFKNSNVLFEGLSGTTGYFTATFENCTFQNLGVSASIEVANYLEGTVTIKNCTFDLTATGGMSAIESSNSKVTWIFEGKNTVKGTAATASGQEGSVDQIAVGNPAVKVYSINQNSGTVVNGLDTVAPSGIAVK